jgi:hypothetical protein
MKNFKVIFFAMRACIEVVYYSKAGAILKTYDQNLTCGCELEKFRHKNAHMAFILLFTH